MNQTVRQILTGKIVLIPLGLICLYSLIGFVITPWAIERYAPQILDRKFHQPLGMGKVRINPYALTLTIDDILIGAPEAPLIACRKLFIDFEITQTPSRGAAFRRILLENPAVHLIIDPDGRSNLEKAFTDPAPSNSADSRPFRLWIETAQISKGTFAYTDRRHTQPVRFTLQDIDVSIANISTLPEQTGDYDISARTSDGETLACQGKISVEPFNTHGSLTLKNVHTETLRPFAAGYISLESTEGKCSLETDYVLHATDKGMQLQLDKLRLETLDLSLKTPGSDNAFLALKQLQFDGIRFNLMKRDIRIGQVRIADGGINLHIDESGRIDMAQIVRTDSGGKMDTAKPQTAAGGKESPDLPWTAVADNITLRDIAFTLNDDSRITPLQLKISDIGMDFSATYHADTSAPKFLVENFSSQLKDIGIQRSGDMRPVFETRQLNIDGGMVDIGTRTVSVSRIALNGGRIDALRDSAGQINWQHLFAPRQTAREPTEQAPSAAPGTPWNYRIHSFEMDGFGVDVSDMETVADTPLLTVESFSGKLSDIDGRSIMGFQAGFSLSQGGMAAIHGKIDPAIPSVEADIQLDALSLKPLQPYLDTYTYLILQSAELSLQGNLQYGTKTAQAAMAYIGSARLDKLNLTETHASKTLIGCDQFHIPKCTLTLDPNRLDIDEIHITKPTGELIIAPDHRLNLSKVFKPRREDAIRKESSQNHPAPADKKTFPVHIGKIDIRKGDIIFADLSLEPQFMTRITDLEGLIRGLSSVGDSPSPIRLNGHVDPYGMARVNGKIDIFHPERSTDLSLVFKNIEMTNLTPYSGKFAGRRITSGKLSLDLKYRVENHLLVGDNQIMVENLTLGEHVESPTAVNLPLDLAVALLKDSNGRIQIGLPVSGDLNNPQFSYGDLLWKAFTNVLTQLVTSPFRALKSLFGGRDELDDHVIFEPGEAKVMPPEKEKLVHLAEILRNRPQLKLTVQGRFRQEEDRATIKAKTVRRSVLDHSRKFSDGENEALVGLDFTDSPTQEALEKLFTEKAGRPAFDELKRSVTTHTSNQADIPRILSEKLYTRLLEMETISSEKLIQLAEDRSRQIIHEMETVGGIPAERLAASTPEAQSSGPPSAVLSLDAQTASQ